MPLWFRSREGFLNGTLVKNHIDASESVWLSGYVKVIAHIFSFVYLIVAEIIMGIWLHIYAKRTVFQFAVDKWSFWWQHCEFHSRLSCSHRHFQTESIRWEIFFSFSSMLIASQSFVTNDANLENGIFFCHFDNNFQDKWRFEWLSFYSTFNSFNQKDSILIESIQIIKLSNQVNLLELNRIESLVHEIVDVL